MLAFLYESKEPWSFFDLGLAMSSPNGLAPAVPKGLAPPKGFCFPFGGPKGFFFTGAPKGPSLEGGPKGSLGPNGSLQEG